MTDADEDEKVGAAFFALAVELIVRGAVPVDGEEVDFGSAFGVDAGIIGGRTVLDSTDFLVGV